MDDNKLQELLKHNEEQWYGLLLDRYTAYVTAIVSGIAKGSLTASDIEEAAADIFFKVWCKRTDIRTRTLKAFVAQVARNTAIDRLRAKGQEIVPYEDDVMQVSYHERPDELAIMREQKQIIEEAVDAFGEPEREIFIRFYYFGETIKIISERLCLNATTTKTKLHRMRSKLREIMEERGYGCE